MGCKWRTKQGDDAGHKQGMGLQDFCPDEILSHAASREETKQRFAALQPLVDQLAGIDRERTDFMVMFGTDTLSVSQAIRLGKIPLKGRTLEKAIAEITAQANEQMVSKSDLVTIDGESYSFIAYDWKDRLNEAGYNGFDRKAKQEGSRRGDPQDVMAYAELLLMDDVPLASRYEAAKDTYFWMSYPSDYMPTAPFWKNYTQIMQNEPNPELKTRLALAAVEMLGNSYRWDADPYLPEEERQAISRQLLEGLYLSGSNQFVRTNPTQIVSALTRLNNPALIPHLMNYVGSGMCSERERDLILARVSDYSLDADMQAHFEEQGRAEIGNFLSKDRAPAGYLHAYFRLNPKAATQDLAAALKKAAAAGTLSESHASRAVDGYLRPFARGEQFATVQAALADHPSPSVQKMLAEVAQERAEVGERIDRHLKGLREAAEKDTQSTSSVWREINQKRVNFLNQLSPEKLAPFREAFINLDMNYETSSPGPSRRNMSHQLWTQALLGEQPITQETLREWKLAYNVNKHMSQRGITELIDTINRAHHSLREG